MPETPDTGEFGLIGRHFAPLAAVEPGALGLLDDAAVLDLPPGRPLVATTDMLVEGVHFLPADPPGSVGRKLMAVNLSDLAAMGAEPRACLLAIAVPRAWCAERRDGWIAGLAAGIAVQQAAFGCVLVGGDTVSTPGPLTISLTAFGTAAAEGVLRRSGATAGETVWVSGTIGDATLGLKVLTGALEGLPVADAAALVERYRTPSPRVALGRALAGLATSCADVSDGLVADLGHICAASGVDATLDAVGVPLSPAAAALVAADPALLPALLRGGDDYELVFTAPASRAKEIETVASVAGVPVTPIGRVSAPPGRPAGAVAVVDPSGAFMVLPESGWRHF